jgi:signal transduction histidine kinase
LRDEFNSESGNPAVDATRAVDAYADADKKPEEKIGEISIGRLLGRTQHPVKAYTGSDPESRRFLRQPRSVQQIPEDCSSQSLLSLFWPTSFRCLSCFESSPAQIERGETMSSVAIRFTQTSAFRYIFAVTAILAILWACRTLNPFIGNNVTYIILLPVVAFVAWYCGLGPSILAIALALGGAMYLRIPGQFALIQNSARSIGALAFLFASVVIVALGEARRRDNERLRNTQGELEARVQERTVELDTANQHLRMVSARLLHLQDEERRRIARGLHDSIGQMLAALSMNLAGVRAGIDRLMSTTSAVIDSENLVQQMSTEVRTISHLLHPPLLDEAGLPSALRWYCDGFSQRSKIDVDLDCPTDFGRLPRDAETAIFRLVQECLTNIHRHSGSATARIHLRHDRDKVVVSVEDNGKGIPMEKLDEMSLPGTAGVGLTGMRERVRQLGGTLAIDSNNHGTKIAARIPVVEMETTEDSMPETASPATV